CGLTCSVNHGPYSPLRQGSANNIYVVPVPDRLSVGKFILMAAACCIPSIISAIRMWTRILDSNWKIRFAAVDALLPRTTMILESFLSVAQLMFFFPAFVSVLVLTERNFGSPQLSYQTEPFASIGQWFPCVGAGILLIVAMYFLLVAHPEPDNEKAPEQQQATPPAPVVSDVVQPSAEVRGSMSESGENETENLGWELRQTRAFMPMMSKSHETSYMATEEQ
ncbi:hypothetical protein QBC37DRAFT_462916, partial [Rhypophila decipiens]